MIKKIRECTYEELQQYNLVASDERIPLFDDVLELVKSTVPLIIEVKPEGDCIGAAKILYNHIKDYNGIYCIESFQPLVVAWFKRNAPYVIRGQLSKDYFKDGEKQSFGLKIVLTNLLLYWLAKPQFITYNHHHENQFSYCFCRKISRVKNVAWVIRSQAELEKAKEVFDVIIFDGFQPR